MSKIKNKIISNIIQMNNLMILKNLLPIELIYEVNEYIKPSRKQFMEELKRKIARKDKRFISTDVCSLYPYLSTMINNP